MKDNTEYERRELLLKAAREEFMQKGYNKASLRTICANAGMTTGALYFFFENKADLFAAIVDPPINGLKKILHEHFKEDTDYMSHLRSIDDIEMDHADISDMIVEHIYDNYESIILVLNSSENTIYENIVDEFVRYIEEATPSMITAMPGYTYDEYMSHWMAHITIDAFIQVIKHERDKDTARIKLRGIVNYLVKGWIELVMVKE